MSDDPNKPSPYLFVQIPGDVPGLLTFVGFVEHVGDHSPVFRSTSGVARLVMVLQALAQAESGVARFERAGWQLLVDALLAEGDQALSLEFGAWVETADGEKTFQKAVIPNRVWSPYVQAILTATPEKPAPLATCDTTAQAAE